MKRSEAFKKYKWTAVYGDGQRIASTLKPKYHPEYQEWWSTGDDIWLYDDKPPKDASKTLERLED